jgi:hypothetical protein
MTAKSDLGVDHRIMAPTPTRAAGRQTRVVPPVVVLGQYDGVTRVAVHRARTEARVAHVEPGRLPGGDARVH